MKISPVSLRLAACVWGQLSHCTLKPVGMLHSDCQLTCVSEAGHCAGETRFTPIHLEGFDLTQGRASDRRGRGSPGNAYKFRMKGRGPSGVLRVRGVRIARLRQEDRTNLHLVPTCVRVSTEPQRGLGDGLPPGQMSPARKASMTCACISAPDAHASHTQVRV